jgi:hypothetical protein
MPAMSGNDVAPGYGASRQEVEDYIRQAAADRGMDPEVVMKVVKHEGFDNWQSSVVKDGVREPSFGPFQLYTGGGMGNDFQRDTGKDPSDPSTWRDGVNYALDKAKQGGWAPWYGAKAAGITGFMGINGQPGAPAPAGLLAQQPTSPGAQASAQGLLAQLGTTAQNPTGQPTGGGLLGGQAAPQQQQAEAQSPDASQQQGIRRRAMDMTRLKALAQRRPLGAGWMA